jgi:hypothetical protein
LLGLGRNTGPRYRREAGAASTMIESASLPEMASRALQTWQM